MQIEESSGQVVPVAPAAGLGLSSGSPIGESSAGLIRAFLEGRNPKTLLAYRQDLESFRRYVEAPSLENAARTLLSQRLGEANRIAIGYRAALSEAKLSPARINRRLAAVRSLVKLARTLGIAPWTLEIKNVRSQSYRDTRGPGALGIRRLLGALKETSGPKAARDRAILRLLHDLGLRRNEVVTLNLEDVDLTAGTIAVLGKGRTQKETLTLPEPTKAALGEWLACRGNEPGALFTNFDRARKGARLSGTSLYRIIRDLGTVVGLRVRPHGIRHAAITEALDLTRGDVRAVQRFSRHKDLRILNAYDDSREDLAGKVARLVAGDA